MGGALLVVLAALHASALPSLVARLNDASLGATSLGIEASWLMVSAGLAITGVSAMTCRRSGHDGRHLTTLHAVFAHAAWIVLLAFLGFSPLTLLAAASAFLLTFPLFQKASPE